MEEDQKVGIVEEQKQKPYKVQGFRCKVEKPSFHSRDTPPLLRQGEPFVTQGDPASSLLITES